MRKISVKFLGLIFFSLCMGQGLMTGKAFAQFYDSPGLGQQPISIHPQDYKPLGVRAGTFMLHPGVQLAGEYTDNAFYSNDNEQDDTVLHVRPYINAQSTWSRHSLNVSLAADIARYNDFGERDYEDYMFGIDGRVDVRARSFLTYTLDYMDLHEGLNNRSSEQGVKVTEYNLQGASIGYDHTFNRLSLSGKYQFYQLDFDNVLGPNNRIIDNQDRDRKSNAYTLRAGYQFQTEMQAFVSYTGYKIDYDHKFDRSGYNREGDGWTISSGLNLTLTGKLEGDIFASYHERKFDDSRLPDVTGWAAGAGLQWNPTDMTSVYAKIASSVQDTTDKNSSGFLQTVYSLRADHELTRFIQLSGFVAYRVADYQRIDPTLENSRSKDDVFLGGVGLNWFINRAIYLNASYGHEALNSSVMDDDYTTNTFWLVIGLER